MVMYAPYRCCCGEPTDCCKVWCECPDEITVSLCKHYTDHTNYACGMADNVCTNPITNGDVIGQFYQAWKINNLKLVKVTNGVVNEYCTGCCKYVAATGEAQTGTVEAWENSWFVNCYEKDGEDCVTGNKTCEGYLLGPLSGSAGTWTLSNCSAELFTECCSSSSCDGQSIRAVLSIAVSGVRTDATETVDCCTQLTTTGGIAVQVNFRYEWDCRHQSRWVDTCPCDLMEESGKATVSSGTVTGCSALVFNDVCPCNTVGQLSDYSSDCTTIPAQPVISGCTETVTGIICTTPGNNGSIESISGCA